MNPLPEIVIGGPVSNAKKFAPIAGLSCPGGGNDVTFAEYFHSTAERELRVETRT